MDKIKLSSRYSSPNPSSATGSNSFSNDMNISRGRTFVRCRSIDLDEIGLYRSVNISPTNNHVSKPEQEFDPIDRTCKLVNDEPSPENESDIKNVTEEDTLTSTVINMESSKIKNIDETIEEDIQSIELKLISRPLKNLRMVTSENQGQNATNDKLRLQIPSPSSALLEKSPSTAPPEYSKIFANIGKCVMMPIDTDYEAKYRLMNKMNGINGVNSFFPPGMKSKPEKTWKEHIYLFLEHPSGWICFFYHMFV